MAWRILHIEGGARLYGGALQVLYLMQGLAERNVENHLICRPHCALATQAQAVSTVHPLSMAGDGDLRLIWRLRRLIEFIQPDIVHLHSRIGVDVMGGIAAHLAQRPVIHTRRVDNPEPIWQSALKYRLYDRVIAISQAIFNLLVQAGIPETKLRLARSAVAAHEYDHPCDREQLCAHFGLPNSALIVGVIAQLIPRKGHATLLAALPSLCAEHPYLQVLFFGQGSEEARLRALAKQTGYASRIHFVGFCPDLAAWLPCLDIVAHPAYREGLGIALLQASAAGVPIVASAVGGIPEAVHDQVNGLLVPAGDAEAWRETLAVLLRDPQRRQQLGQAGKALIAAEFSITSMVMANMHVYRELIVSDAHDV
jgi:glycosyltransferase involved in cell wall biosynthesis